MLLLYIFSIFVTILLLVKVLYYKDYIILLVRTFLINK